jgi:DNA excision repair protein ERCC-4
MPRPIANPIPSKNPIRIFVDFREQGAPLPDLLQEAGFDVELVKLPVGDYVLDNSIFIERKTGQDFVISIIDGRLFKQAGRMKQSSYRCLFLIEGSPFDTTIDISREAVKGALLSLQAIWYIPVLYAPDAEQSCHIFAMLSKQRNRSSHLVELRHDYRPKKLKTRKLHIIQGLPNVGPLIAKCLLDHFQSVRSIMNATEIELSQVEGIGKTKAQMIRSVLS